MVQAVELGLTDPDRFEREAGYCWKWTREVLAAAGVPFELIPPVGVDAKGALLWYAIHGGLIPLKKGSVPGDVLFFTSPKHGPHGHVGFRTKGNTLAENSTAHAPEGEEDGRGERPLTALGPIGGILRLWGVNLNSPLL